MHTLISKYKEIKIEIFAKDWTNNWSEPAKKVHTVYGELSRDDRKAIDFWIQQITVVSEEYPKHSNCFYNNGRDVFFVISERGYTKTGDWQDILNWIAQIERSKIGM